MPSDPERPIVCYVTDGSEFAPADRNRLLLDRVEVAISAGVDWVQIREKDLSTQPLLDLVTRAVQLAPSLHRNTRISVNDRTDVAWASGAAGVHLGKACVPADAVVRWRRAGNVGADFAIGVSCHSLQEAQLAASAGADYIFFGPVFDTPSKRAFGKAQGVPRLAEVCQRLNIPVLAIGGIDEHTARECLRVGAAGIAAIRLFQRALDLAALTDVVSSLHEPG